MVKIALVGDVHLTQSKHKEFAANRFAALCGTISTKKYDMVIFMGDLFDRARPSLEEIQLLQFCIMKLNDRGVRTLVFDGNHEAVTKDSSTFDYLRIEGLEYLPYDLLDIEGVKIHTLGYSNLSKYILLPKCDILLSHFRSNFGIIKEEISTEEVSKKANIVFLGDIHQEYSPLPNVHYTSSPYGIHFSKENHKHGYVELVVNNGTYEFSRVPLDLPNKLILELDASSISKVTPNGNLLRIKVKGTPEELESLPRVPNVQYITSLKLKEETSLVSTKSIKANILESTIELVGDTLESRELLTRIYKEVT